MGWSDSNPIEERTVLRALVAGFTLVLALLGLAGYVAIRSTRAIEQDAADVGREQLAMARLLNDVQAGQNTMAAIIHRLAPGQQETADRAQLIHELEGADEALTKLAASAMQSSEAHLWRDLGKAVRQFSAGVRRAIADPAPRTATDLAHLFDLHDRVVRIEQQLLIASEKRVEQTERAIETESHDLAVSSQILLGACLVLALLCAALTVSFARRSIRKIENQASELSRVSWHLLQSQESLARRFSHELHDELGQSLAAVKANLNASGRPADWAAHRADCLQLVDSAIANVRELSQLLHPVILDDFGLDAGLRWLTDGFAQRTSIAVDYVSAFRGRLNDEIETHLFRIAQEAFTNIARHSRATRVKVELLEVAPGHVRMSIEDNGLGLPDTSGTHPPASLGMIGMRARAREIQAQLQFGVPPDGGLRIDVDVPPRTSSETENGNHVKQPEKAHPLGR
ncbi:MAG: hypothetical protein JNL98_07875 [Bryobacterales bacterium]|nr:hypothetical protein [Bryobacterales bacterium]